MAMVVAKAHLEKVRQRQTITAQDIKAGNIYKGIRLFYKPNQVMDRNSRYYLEVLVKVIAVNPTTKRDGKHIPLSLSVVVYSFFGRGGSHKHLHVGDVLSAPLGHLRLFD